MGVLRIFLILLLCFGCQKQNREKNKLLGAWSIEEVSWQSKDTTVSIIPSQKGMLVVTPKHYSISWCPIQEGRSAFHNLSQPNELEVLQAFKTIVFNSGGYRLKKGDFITEATIAKVPGFEGGKQFYQYQVLDNENLRLTLYDETYPSGEKPNWHGTWKTIFSLRKYQE